MAFQTPITISTALGSIERREYVLPAIQREFVWWPEQIECLFDSLMRGYPIGSFLFWIVRPEGIEKYKFYDFMLDYHERDNAHCASVGAVTRDEITAVLDGQQRRTALNIGLRGSYAYKLPRLWRNNPNAFPVRRLYLNLLSEAEENEYDMQYDFRFLTSKEAARRDETHCWYRVGDILRAEDAVDLHDFLVDHELANQHGPFKVLAGLHEVVRTKPVVAYYREEDQDLDKVLHVFIRTNSGGTKLSYSAMLMSMATAQWETLDARAEIHGKVDEINDMGGGFGFSQDFLLKAERLEDAMRARGKNLTFEEDELEDIVESQDRAFALLSVLYPFVDTQNNKFHIDHVFPKSRFASRRLRRAGVPDDDVEEYQDRVDRLPNLQLLAGDLNQSKSDVHPGEWIATFEPRAAREYAEHHDLGDVPADITGFNVFYEARRARLLSRLRRLLGTDRRERGTP